MGSFFKRLAQGLQKTAASIGGGFRRLLGRRVDQDLLDELETTLITADCGLDATDRIVARVKDAFAQREVTGDLLDFVKKEMRGMLEQGGTALASVDSPPTVIMVCGVNGSGKTTSIAKLATFLSKQGKKVLLGAGDTFRAAAVDQLSTWAERTGSDIVKASPGSDPASVAFDACSAGKSRGADIVIVDTAGRLHTQAPLMKELEKIHRVIGKAIPGAPHEVLLVLDATNGQNAILQAKQFTKSVGCTGIILSKLDGTAKGGAVISIHEQLGLPVKFIGIGEKADDLEVFDPDAFIDALFSSM
ncbi:signal recognition particle-docking protein FtsY [bacterium]|nr:signal recognition particle-docking protein FtsY [bacterium]